MKLKTHLPVRRDGKLPCIETGNGRRGESGISIAPDAAGEYDVPDDLVQGLVDTGNFYHAGEPPKSVSHVITCDDGKQVDLDELTRAELVEFGKANFDLEFKQADTKPVLIAAIMAEIEPDETPDA